MPTISTTHEESIYQHWKFFYDLQKFLLCLSEPYKYLYPIEYAVNLHADLVKDVEP